MEKRNSNLWLGLAIGSVVGALAYRFARTPRAKRMKEQVCDTLHKMAGQAKDALNTAKEKASEVGQELAEKAADKTYEFGAKVDDLKTKASGASAEMKR